MLRFLYLLVISNKNKNYILFSYLSGMKLWQLVSDHY
jgi:hypothetical protein